MTGSHRHHAPIQIVRVILMGTVVILHISGDCFIADGSSSILNFICRVEEITTW